MSDIERRLGALEKTNRRWRFAAGLLGGVLLVVLTAAAKLPDEVPKVLQAKRIEVLASDGKPSIVLSTENNASVLRLTDPGKDRERAVYLMSSKEGAFLALMKNAEAPLLFAKAVDEGSSLALFDGRQPSQKPRGIMLGSAYSAKNQKGGTSIALMKGLHKESIRAELSMQEASGDASLMLGGSEGNTVSLRVNQKNGKVDFLDHNNQAIWTTP